jgi:hypothetical protein
MGGSDAFFRRLIVTVRDCLVLTAWLRLEEGVDSLQEVRNGGRLVEGVG